MIEKIHSYFLKNGRICKNDTLQNGVRTVSKKGEEDKAFSYDEAVELTGHGPYSLMLLLAASFSMLGYNLDMFAFTSIMSVAACDLGLTSRIEKILVSLPFIAAIITAFPWGYVSDTRGRRGPMLVGMWVSFTASCLGALSPHWIMLGFFKFVSVCFSNSFTCSYTLIGECCRTKVKAVYFYILTSIIHLCFPIQMTLHYFTLTQDFSYDLGFITFVPWRFLALALAMPLGLTALCLHLCYESPKFLTNIGQESRAVDILGKIWKRNGGSGLKYPVMKLVLKEDGNCRRSEESLLWSLWNQVIPLFKTPLLKRTLQLYFITAVIYGGCGGLLSWFPYLANAFISGASSNRNGTEGLCNMISQFQEVKHEAQNASCVPKSDLTVVWASLAQGVSLAIITSSVTVVASRRKSIMITVLMIAALAALGCAVVPNNIISLTSYFAIFLCVVGTGIVFSYCVDLYPTSYRCMVSCLSILVARGSNLITVNIVGSLFMSHCNVTFFLIAALFFSGVIVAFFLPADKPVKST